MGKLVTIGRAHRGPLRLHGTIARDLGIGIVSGLYKPGDILSGEVASSERLAVSRTAYREAVRILAAKGLVESRPKVGTKVSTRDQWQLLDPDVLAWAFDSEPDLELLDSLFELRDIIESEAAALAGRRPSPSWVSSLSAANRVAAPSSFSGRPAVIACGRGSGRSRRNYGGACTNRFPCKGNGSGRWFAGTLRTTRSRRTREHLARSVTTSWISGGERFGVEARRIT